MKNIITSLTLKEISAVDRPAQIGAKMTIMKRASPAFAVGDVVEFDSDLQTEKGPSSGTIKEVDGTRILVAHSDAEEWFDGTKLIVSEKTTAADGKRPLWIMKRDAPATVIAKGIYGMGEEGKAIAFKDVLMQSEERRRQYEAREELWPLFDALQTSLSSTSSDTSLSDADRMGRIEASVADFLAAVREKLPDVEEELAKALVEIVTAGSSGSPTVKKGDLSMADEKKVEELQKSLDTLTTTLAEVTKRAETAETIAKMSDTEKKHLATLSEADKAKFMAMSAEDRAKIVTKAASEDETVVVEGQSIAKSAVGDSTFAIFKAQAARIEAVEKAAAVDRDNALMVTLTKRAEDELGNLPGESVKKAAVLKAVATMGEEERTTLDTMLKAANSSLAKAFTTLGVKKGSTGGPSEQFDAAVKKHAADHNVSVDMATAAVMKSAEGNALYQQSRAEQAA